MPQEAFSATPSTPLNALARRWWLALLLVVVGGGAGAVFGGLQAPTYTGEARVAVGSESLDARIVAGYSLAATQLASDIARYVNDAQAQAALAPVLGDAARDVSTVAASPIADSSVVRIEVQATTRKAAVDGAQAVAQQLADQVNATTTESADTLLQQYTQLSTQVATAQQTASDAQGALASAIAGEQAQPVVDAARTAVEQANSALAVLEVQQQALSQRYRSAVTNTPAAAGLRVVQTGQLAGDDRGSHVQKFGLAGAVLGLLVALLVAVVLDRRRVSRTSTPDTDPAAPAVDTDRSLDVDRAGLEARATRS